MSVILRRAERRPQVGDERVGRCSRCHRELAQHCVGVDPIYAGPDIAAVPVAWVPVCHPECLHPEPGATGALGLLDA